MYMQGMTIITFNYYFQILLKVDIFGGCKLVEVDAFAVVELHYATDLAIMPTLSTGTSNHRYRSCR